MSDTTEAIKKYWPWVAGGVVGLLLISKMRGGGTSDPLAAAYAAQNANAVQNAAIGEQAKQREQAYQLNMTALTGQLSQQMAQIDAQKAVAMADIGRQSTADSLMIAGQTQIGSMNAQANYVLAQGQAGLAAAQGASQLVAQFQSPAIAALNASAMENMTAMQTAGQVAMAGFGAQAGMIQSTAGGAVGLGNALAQTNLASTAGIASMAGSLGAQMQGIGNMKPPDQSAKNEKWKMLTQLGMAAMA